ncbi:hypothetical protein HMPREF9714_03177 [Myroides odoratimimus CCUG 12901]|uniref:hypothetical protein n=1 Tax=Myroides odoratimimus TaxID=76832 RepID=UPI0002460790|nr:hypothetical protein [Myroides odoratimimus]EHO05505.1 hypothetical protein HMPREF9714_03177 [Myroides odoratimimus CCUG 12901]MCO7722961.1 hypothetical protein [Myroides odoratimimus]MDM1494032.1 hypothetical protein [Myroides odoratimimus]MDM1506147.1 hypothetical protein [Myroides odoratimimus]MDM1509503.1 hypothetical protein [Myroides odoratimimus]
MDLLKNRIVALYLNGSVHVSLAVFALVQMTFYFCHLPFDAVVSTLAFTGTLFSYNFIKYAEVIYRHKNPFTLRLKVIIGISIIALLIGTVAFFMLNWKAQFVTLSLLVLSVLYAIPISSNRSNLRNLAGLKVYIVCLCWATVTLIVPVMNADIPVSWDIVVKFIQRFILVFILIGIFEVVDLQYDDKYLKTLPQMLGIANTKWLLGLLLIPFYVIEFFKVGYQPIQAWNNMLIVLLTLFFIVYASPKRTKFFTLFWVESVPIVWWLIVVIQGNAIIWE